MVPLLPRSLGSVNCKGRFFHHFPQHTPFKGGYSHQHPQIRQQTVGNDRSDREPSDQESSGTSASLTERPGILLQPIPGPKENRRMETSSKPQTLKPVCGEKRFQTGFHQDDQERYTPRGLRHVFRPEGCLPPPSYPPRTPEIPQIPLQGRPLAVSGPTFWPFFSPHGFLQSAQPCDRVVPPEGNSSYGLPRRLAAPRPRSGGIDTRNQASAQYAVPFGMDRLRKEVPVDPASFLPVHRSSFRSCTEYSDSCNNQSRVALHSGRKTKQSSSLVSERVHADFGAPGIHDWHHSTHQATHERSPNVSTTPVESKGRSSVKEDSFGPRGKGEPLLVGGPVQLDSRRSYTRTSYRDMHHHRCLQIGMGGTLGRQDSERQVAQRRAGPHQRFGVEGSDVSPGTLGTAATEQTDPHPLRQYLRSPVHKSPRGDHFPEVVSAGSGTVDDSREKQHMVEGSSHQGGDECDCGLTFPGEDQDSMVRVVSLSPSSETSVCAVRLSKHRPVCLQIQQEAPNLLQLGPGPERFGAGQLKHRVEQHVGIRLSSNFPDSAGTPEDSALGIKDSTHSPLVAASTLVSGTDRSTSGCTSPPPHTTESPATQSEHDAVPRFGIPKADSVAAFQQHLVKEGVPDEARDMVLASWRPSTIRVYSAQFGVFCRWCQGISKDPLEASIEDVLKFLQHLFSKGLQYKTICVYRSMLSNILPPSSGRKVGEMPQVIRFLKGVFNSRPPRKMLTPEWDLPLVLNVLSAAPFEPLKSASLKLVSFKFCFLLALTTARRVSDVSKLAIGDHCRVQKGKVTFLPTTLAKADDPSHFQQEVVIRSFKEKLLCPVRALKWYLKKTETIRGEGGDAMILLRCLNSPYRPPSSQTVSRWLVRTIKMAYEIHPHLPKGRARAHSLRAVAPNWAHFKGASKRDILQAADWRRETTFIKHYQRHIKLPDSQFGEAVLSAAQL